MRTRVDLSGIGQALAEHVVAALSKDLALADVQRLLNLLSHCDLITVLIPANPVSRLLLLEADPDLIEQFFGASVDHGREDLYSGASIS